MTPRFSSSASARDIPSTPPAHIKYTRLETTRPSYVIKLPKPKPKQK